MGFNTTVIILNDALHQIAEDKDFGKNLSGAILHRSVVEKSVNVPAGNHANAALVVETHHADGIVAVLVGGNYGEVLGHVGNWRLDASTPEGKKEVLRSLARRFGLTISIREK